MSDRSTGLAPSKLTAVLGPTNTGKTHLAVERMLGHASGMIGLPLRLLAREIYDRIVKLRGKASVALITGEEKIVPPRAAYFVCTVEAMPLGREVEFVAVDEIQLCADPERGHIFTHRLLHARGKYETMLLGAGTMAPLVRRLLPDAEIVTRERFSNLTYSGSKKLTRLPRRSAVVAFSTDAVYAIAELIRRQRGGAAVVMGSLSPRTRNAQVALYQSGEVDFLVATDAIGMGLNMDVDHVAFAGLRKFDGKRTRWLHPQEVGQIAGRAGRYTRDGTFGVTGDCEEMDEDLVESVVNHQFEPVMGAEWRNARLDFGSLQGLLRSLAEPPQRGGLSLSEEALDERTLRKLAQQEDVVARCKADRSALIRLWDVCQTPDFRKTTDDDHQRMVRTLFDDLTTGRKRLPEDWIAGQFKALDRTDGEIDSLAARLSGVRTLSYIANRGDWLHNPVHWQGTTRQLEDRLSDTLHEKLMARFIDRRTSVLMRQLGDRETMLAGVGADGAVTVEGHVVGRLTGVTFVQEKGASALEEKALRNTAQRAVTPEIARRLGKLASEPDSAFALTPDGAVLWNGEAAGAVRSGVTCCIRAPTAGRSGRRRGAGAGRATAGRLPGRRGRPQAARPAQAGAGAGRRRAEGPAARPGPPAAGGRRRAGQALGRHRPEGHEPGRAAQSQGPGRADRGVQPVPAVGAARRGPGHRPRPDAGRLARPVRAPGRRAQPHARRPRPGRQRPAPGRQVRRSRRDAGAPGRPAARGPEARRGGADRRRPRGPGLDPGRGRRRAAGPGLHARPPAQGGRPDPVEAARRPAARAQGHGPSGLAVRGPGQADRAAAEAEEASRRRKPARREGRLMTTTDAGHCRADVWLWRARFFKTRSLAGRFVEEGRIRLTRTGVESRVDKPSRGLRIGDALVFAIGGRHRLGAGAGLRRAARAGDGGPGAVRGEWTAEGRVVR
jgi:superfamily II DNA/RNA helicase/ribosomal 50S subunit-recycling heat shock protein